MNNELIPLVGSLEEDPLAVKLLDNRLYMTATIARFEPMCATILT